MRGLFDATLCITCNSNNTKCKCLFLFLSLLMTSPISDNQQSSSWAPIGPDTRAMLTCVRVPAKRLWSNISLSGKQIIQSGVFLSQFCLYSQLYLLLFDFSFMNINNVQNQTWKHFLYYYVLCVVLFSIIFRNGLIISTLN